MRYSLKLLSFKNRNCRIGWQINKEQNGEVCDARNDATRNKAGNQRIMQLRESAIFSFKCLMA